VPFRLRFAASATAELQRLAYDRGLQDTQASVNRALAKMEINLRHPGLKTHTYKGKDCPHGNDLFEAYAQNKTAGAPYRIFFCYVPGEKDMLLIVDIVPHP
jgi:hypothetical protein